jgi:hypothetical protein
MTQRTDAPEPLRQDVKVAETTTRESLDHLVNALKQAVARKQAARTEDTDHRT